MEHKTNILNKLVAIGDTKAMAALRIALNNASKPLTEGSDYQQIEEAIKVLEIISPRLSAEVIEVYKVALDRLSTITLDYPEKAGKEEAYRAFFTNNRLISCIIEALAHIRYHQPDSVLVLLMEYANSSDEAIRNASFNGLKAFTKYNIPIIYGDDDWKGLGFAPQRHVLTVLEALSIEQKRAHFDAIVKLVAEILSPTMENTRSDYQTVTWESGELPADKQVKELRNRSLELLQGMYQPELSNKEKLSLINTANSAGRGHHGKSTNEFQELVADNAKWVLEFYFRVIQEEKDLDVLQHIEQDAYWLLYHRGHGRDEIAALAFKVRDFLLAHPEYSIYRVLIGFRSVFDEWTTKPEEKEEFSSKYKRMEEWRTNKVVEFVEGINDDSYPEWEDRIVRYSQIQSDDMATFPFFGKFLELFGEKLPKPALQLLKTRAAEITPFVVAILYGVWKSAPKEVLELLNLWVAEGKLLPQVGRLCGHIDEVKIALLGSVLNKAIEAGDANSLIYVISAATNGYDSSKKEDIASFVVPAIAALTAHADARWVHDTWFRKEASTLFSDMTAEEGAVVLNNLLTMKKLDYHCEGIVAALAGKQPARVLAFLKDRLEKDDVDSTYDAIPYELHELGKALAPFPEVVIPTIRTWFKDGDSYGLFIYKGARLVENIFPEFSESMQQELLKLIQTGNERDILFVMAVLRSYDGKQEIHEVCKSIVEAMPPESKVLRELGFIIDSTGVVSGEFGFAEAYAERKKYMEAWLEDPRTKVKEFAQKHIQMLEQEISEAIKRAKEDIELRKHKYGG